MIMGNESLSKLSWSGYRLANDKEQGVRWRREEKGSEVRGAMWRRDEKGSEIQLGLELDASIQKCIVFLIETRRFTQVCLNIVDEDCN